MKKSLVVFLFVLFSLIIVTKDTQPHLRGLGLIFAVKKRQRRLQANKDANCPNSPRKNCGEPLSSWLGRRQVEMLHISTNQAMHIWRGYVFYTAKPGCPHLLRGKAAGPLGGQGATAGSQRCGSCSLLYTITTMITLGCDPTYLKMYAL